MTHRSGNRDNPTRRTFVKYVARSLAVLSILGSLACTAPQNQNTESKATSAVSPTPADNRPQKSDCCPQSGGVVESHLPPVIIGGSASVRVETKNRIETANTRPPFEYQEDGPPPPDQRYGNLVRVRVITEMAVEPYVSDIEYSLLPSGARLFIWYQRQEGLDCQFTAEPTGGFPSNDPDLQVKGGSSSGEPFKIIFKHKKLNDIPDPTHKCTRPHRYRHNNIPGLGRHFRIGQWRLVDSAGTVIRGQDGSEFEDKRDEEYTLFLYFAHTQ